MVNTSLPKASKHRLGSLHVGRDKRLYRVSWANAAKKTKVWRVYRKPVKPAKRPVGKSKLRGGTLRPTLPIRAQAQWCMLYKYFSFPPDTTDDFIITHAKFFVPITNALDQNFTDPFDKSELCQSKFLKISNLNDLWNAFAKFFHEMKRQQQTATGEAKQAYERFFKATTEQLKLVTRNYQLMNLF